MKKSTLLTIIALALSFASAKADVVINNESYSTYGYGICNWLQTHFHKQWGDTVTDAELATVKILNTNEMSHASGGSWIGLFPELEHLTVRSWVPPRISGIPEYWHDIRYQYPRDKQNAPHQNNQRFQKALSDKQPLLRRLQKFCRVSDIRKHPYPSLWQRPSRAHSKNPPHHLFFPGISYLSS